MFFVFFFCLLVHRLAVRISLPFHVFLQALFLDDNKTNDDCDGKENGKKYVYINKQQLCTCIKLFCTFLCRRCTTTT